MRGRPDTVHWLDYLAVLRRRKWPALAAFVTALVAGIVHGYTRVPVYQAKVRILFDQERPAVPNIVDPLTVDPLLDFQTQLTILRSRSIARNTMRALALEDRRATDPAAVADQAPGLDSPEESARIDRFLEALQVTQLPDSFLIDVSFTSLDPVTAARTANMIAEQYLQQNQAYKSTASREILGWLADRLAEQKNALNASEIAVQTYRERSPLVATKGQSREIGQQLSDLISAYTKAKTERIEKGAQFKQLEALAQQPGALEGFPPILANPFVRQAKADLSTLQKEQAQLLETLTELHPAIIKVRENIQQAEKRLQSEIDKASQSVQQEYLAAQDSETQIAQAMEALRRESLRPDRSDVELALLQRGAESNRQIYDTLLQRVNELAVTRQHRTDHIRVVDSAEVPRNPVGTGMRNDLRYGAIGGLALAVLLAFLLEGLDNSVKTPRQITNLGVPFLGIVPEVKVADSERPPLVGSGVPATFDEMFRGLRTTLRLWTVAESPRAIVVTSAGTGDGKSTTCANLAIVLAQTARSVLLIDADLRRPRQYRTFAALQEPGLSNVLTQEMAAKDVICRTIYPNLWLLTSGAVPANPAELLDSSHFRNLLVELKQDFDWVIIDASPIMPVTDPIVIAAAGVDVLLVAAADLTPVPALRSAIEQLSQTDANLLGVVLNRANLDGRGYYYSEYYHRSNAGYYQQPPAADRPALGEDGPRWKIREEGRVAPQPREGGIACLEELIASLARNAVSHDEPTRRAG